MLPTVPRSLVVHPRITATSTAQTSQPISFGSTIAVVQSDEPVHVSRNSTATLDNYKVTAGNEQWFTVNPGEIFSILLGT